jgi:D-inositol-3-phosphate glycosyltransferase
MHIALVHRDLHAVTRGGICTLYRALAPRLRDSGHTVTLITQHTQHPLRLQGIRVLTLPRTDDLGAHRAAVDDALSSIGPDVVESSSWEAETLTYAQRATADRAPVVVRGDLSAATMNAWPHLVTAEEHLLRRADAVVAVSEFAATDLATAYDIRRPLVVANGVDRDRFRPGPAPSLSLTAGGEIITLDTDGTTRSRRPLRDAWRLPPPWTDPRDGKLKLVWVGKTTPMKGWDRLEHLVTELRDRAHVTVLLGHAPALCPITVTGAEDNLTILRDLHDDDLPGFYRAADFLLSTSRWEGFGLAIAEALACGTPALLPDDLGTSTELLAADGGHTYSTAHDLRAILTQRPATSGALPTAFAWKRNSEETLAVYENVRAKRTARGGAAVRVLILGPDHPDGSLPPYLDTLADGLRQHGVTADRHGSRTIPYNQDTHQFWPLDQVIAEAHAILDGIQFGDYDVVSLHFGNLEVEQLLPALWADRSLPPVAHHLHTLDPTLFRDHIPSPKWKTAVQQGLRAADGTIYFGQYAREHSSQSTRSDAISRVAWLPTTIPAGTTSRPHQALAAALDADGRPVLSLYGFGAPWKDAALLSAAVDLMRVPARVVLAGDFWDHPEQLGVTVTPTSRGQARRAELVVVPGYLGPADRLALVQASTAGIFPYRQHASFQGSGAIADYLAHGVPVIATDIANMAELIGPGGHIVSSGDPVVLAAAMDHLGEGEPAAAGIVGHAAARAYLFSAETHATRCLQAYLQIVGRSARSRV